MRTRTATAATIAALLALAGCNRSPLAIDDTVSTTPGTPVEVAVLANDTDPDGDPLVLDEAWGAEHGRVEVTADNRVLYIPTEGVFNEDVFHYSVKDNEDRESEAKVRVTMDRFSPGARRAIVVDEPDAIIIDDEPDAVIVDRPGVVAAPGAVLRPGAGPLVDRMLVTLHTTVDDKNADEPVRIYLRRGAVEVADEIVGAGEVWATGSSRTFEIDLEPDVPLANVDEFTVGIEKLSAPGAEGATWTVAPELRGELTNGQEVVLVPRTEPIKMGEGEPFDRTWRLIVPE